MLQWRGPGWTTVQCWGSENRIAEGKRLARCTRMHVYPGGGYRCERPMAATRRGYASAFWSARHIAGFCDDATLKRIQVEGSWLGQKRLPGAAR